MPKPRRSGGSPSMRAPSSQISTAERSRRPARRLSAVDLPQPDGPSGVISSRPRTSRAKSSRAVFAPNRLVSRKRRLSTAAATASELLDALGADLLVPSIHRGDQILHGELGHDLVLLLHVGVLGPPVLAHELLD